MPDMIRLFLFADMIPYGRVLSMLGGDANLIQTLTDMNVFFQAKDESVFGNVVYIGSLLSVAPVEDDTGTCGYHADMDTHIHTHTHAYTHTLTHTHKRASVVIRCRRLACEHTRTHTITC